MNDNMELWDAVEKTDPKYTKKVNQRGGFTAIVAQSQIKEATRQFGKIGIGWGFNVGKYDIQDGFIIVPVTIWHGSRENTIGEILGCAEMFGKRTDSDAPKKATTDAITKGLSYLGFNADVFLGKFDDNKYVFERTAEEAAKIAVPVQKITSEQFIELRDLLETSGVDEDVIITAYGTKSLQELSVNQFDSAVKRLNATIKKRVAIAENAESVSA